jgi:hypothetical protein
LGEDELAALSARVAELLEDSVFPQPDPTAWQVPWPIV